MTSSWYRVGTQNVAKEMESRAEQAVSFLFGPLFHFLCDILDPHLVEEAGALPEPVGGHAVHDCVDQREEAVGVEVAPESAMEHEQA